MRLSTFKKNFILVRKTITTCSFSPAELGNPRGNENPFLLTFGILWFRWHNYWADKIFNETMHEREEWNDEKIFNEARKWVIATYQVLIFIFFLVMNPS